MLNALFEVEAEEVTESVGEVLATKHDAREQAARKDDEVAMEETMVLRD